MPLNSGQRAVTDSTCRFRVVVAGRRWGKTFLAIREAARIAHQPNRRVFLVYPTYRQAKQVIWEPLKYRLQDLRWTDKINESDLTVRLRNGSTISLRGADNPDSLRGVGLDGLVMDEFAMIDQKAWAEVLRPTLSDRQGTALFISTPMGQSNWAYDLYQRGRDPSQAEWASFQYTTLDGGNVTAEEIAQAQQDLDERTFRQEYMATFEMYANRIYYAFDRAQNLVTRTDPTPPVIHVGLDFNVGQMSAAIFSQSGAHLHCFDEIGLLSSNTTEMCEELRARYPTQRIVVYPDPAGAARKTSAAGATDHTILANAGFQVKAPRAHNPVRDGINAVNSRLRTAAGQTYLTVDPGCKRVIESLEKYSYKSGTNVPDKDSGVDHFADSIRYCVDYLYPVRRDVPPQLPQRWGHAIAA